MPYPPVSQLQPLDRDRPRACRSADSRSRATRYRTTAAATVARLRRLRRTQRDGCPAV